MHLTKVVAAIGFASLLVFQSHSGWSSPSRKASTSPISAAGEPGRSATKRTTVDVIMVEGDGKMILAPPEMTFSQGDNVRFVIRNDTPRAHEFVIGSHIENMAHAQTMKLSPPVAHDEPNGRLVAPGTSVILDWRFTNAGSFEAACLLDGDGNVEEPAKITVLPR